MSVVSVISPPCRFIERFHHLAVFAVRSALHVGQMPDGQAAEPCQRNHERDLLGVAHDATLTGMSSVKRESSPSVAMTAGLSALTILIVTVSPHVARASRR